MPKAISPTKLPLVKKRYVCKVCKHRTTGPTKLSQHYQTHPTHAPKYSANRREKRRAGGETAPRGKIRFCTSCGSPRGKRWTFCGRCGTKLS